MGSSWINQTSLNLDLKLQFPCPKGLPERQTDEMVTVEVETSADEIQALEAELDRVNEENKRLSGMLVIMEKNYRTLRTKLQEFTAADACSGGLAKSQSLPFRNNKISGDRSLDAITGERAECTSSVEEGPCKRARVSNHIQDCKPKTSMFHVRTDPSDTTLVVKDGYQWRKYGQKVTRDNPWPRAYFRCSFAPACKVKKKVQRSAEYKSILVATYEGEHNHGKPSHQLYAGGSKSFQHNGELLASSDQLSDDAATSVPPFDAELPKLRRDKLVEQMARSLTNDPSFKSALAAAISGRLIELSPPRN